jgi:hypothetical protein
MKGKQLEDFIFQVRQLEEKLKASIDPDGSKKIVLDGCVDEETYLTSPVKIMWILKEPYGNRDGTMHLAKTYLGKRGIEGDFGNARNTWYPVVYCTYGMLKNTTWDKIPDAGSDSSVCKILKNITVINLKKIPGGKRTPNYEPIKTAYNSYADLFKEQIELYQPQVIIGGNTLFMLKNNFGLSDLPVLGDVDCPYYIDAEHRLWIDAYHPGQSKIKRKRYFDLILTAFNAWQAATGMIK